MKSAQAQTPLIYSDNALCAFIAAIVESFEKNLAAEHYLGRTAMQKLCYFAKVLGVPIPCSFEIYTYGPYSEKVTFAIDSLVADDVLKDISLKSNYSNYRPEKNFVQISSKYANTIGPYSGKIDSVVKNLGKLTPSQFELLATMHFIHHRQREIKRREPTKKEVVQEFQSIKKNKFPGDEIDLVYSALKSAQLI